MEYSDYITLSTLCMGGIAYILLMCGFWRLWDRHWISGAGLIGIGFILGCVAFASVVIGCLPGSWHECLCHKQEHCSNFVRLDKTLNSVATKPSADNPFVNKK